MPAWFTLPDPTVQLWTPVYYKNPATYMHAIDTHDFRVIGRLKPGVSPQQAVNELAIITRRIHNANLSDPFVSVGANIKPLLESLVGNFKTPLYVLLAATGCLLLIACLNTANLLVARAAGRRKELAIRTAMGGSRLRLLRQHLAESLLLSVGGGALGFLFAIGALQWFITIRHDMARSESIAIDWAVAGFSLVLVLTFAAFAGLISAFSLRGEQPLTTLQESTRSSSASHVRTRLRAILLTVEVSLTVVLLIGSGLLIKSYARLRATDIGCLTQNVLKLDINLPQVRYSNAVQISSFFETLLGRVRSIPGIRSAAFISPVVPGNGYAGDSGFAIVEHPSAAQGKMQYAVHRWCDPGYFTTIGIPFLRGHTFTSDQQPGHATQVIVSQTFVSRYLPGEDPIGKHLNTLGKRTFEIVGIVGDVRVELGAPPEQMMYFPLYAVDDMNSAALIIRSDSDVTQFAVPIQRIVSTIDRDLPVSEILTMDQVIGRSALDNSFNATLFTAFAALSLLLAAVGLFGVLSYVVAQRTAEIGIRIALGARRTQVLQKVLADGLRPALIGLAIGIPASAASVDFIKSMLYQTAPIDVAVFATVAITLLCVAVIACMLPAWRASRLDPMQALRTA
jgi:putative ABC transport system permease protein